MPETHTPCRKCRTTDPEAFATPTGAFCCDCWAPQVDHGAKFSRWADDAIARARGAARGPFSA